MTDGSAEDTNSEGSLERERMIKFDADAGPGVIGDEVVELLSASEEERDTD